MSDIDILIAGGGIAGASLGAMLAPTCRVVILEAEEFCGLHSTGRSAAFWLASYGGSGIVDLTRASRGLLEQGWPASGQSWLNPRGAFHLIRRGANWQEAVVVVAAADKESAGIGRPELEQLLPGLRPGWEHARSEPSCADIDVAGLHQACLREFRRSGGIVLTGAALLSAERNGGRWKVKTATGEFRASLIVNAAGAWADQVAGRCGVAPAGLRPKRRTMVQVRVNRSGLTHLPLFIDAEGSFYFKGESDSSLWLSPHDEIDCDPCDAAPAEMDIAVAIDRFQSVVDWPVERVERSWAGLRTFAPDRLPILGYDPDAPGFFWFAGQGGFGIQTAPAAAQLGAALLLQDKPRADVARIDPARFSPGRFRL